MRYVDCRAFARSWPGAAHLRRRKRTRESFSPPGWMQRLNGLVLKCSNAVVQHRHRIGNLRASGANFGAALYFGREMPGSVPVAHKRKQLVATMDLEPLEWAVAVRPLAIPSYVQPFRSADRTRTHVASAGRAATAMRVRWRRRIGINAPVVSG